MTQPVRIISLLLCLLFSVALRAQDGPLLATLYKPSFQKGTIGQYLTDIEQKAGIPVSFSDAAVNAEKQVKLKKKEITVKEALATILIDEQVDIVERGNKILIIAQAPKKKSIKGGSYTINGYVKEEGSKEVLIGAIIYIPGMNVGTTTNSYGFYSISLPEGTYKAVCSYTGYLADTFTLVYNADSRKDILLRSENMLETVVVTPEDKPRPDRVQLSPQDINSRPALLGEGDVMRALQNLAGVQCAGEGGATILVRGGNPGQNLFLLDGVPVYYTDHFFAVTSVFNTEAIRSVDFYKGAFPARYGGRLSSIVDVSTKDGDMEKWGGQFSIGLVKASLNLEGPIIKDKASIMVSARRTWIDALWRPFTDELAFNFYDVNVKANYILNKNNRLFVSVYNGRDQFKVALLGTGDMQVKWGNTVTAARWSTILTPKFFLHTTLAYSNFNYQMQDRRRLFSGTELVDIGGYTGTSLIKDLSLKTQAHWYPTVKHHVEVGAGYSRSNFTPVSVSTDVNVNNNVDPTTTRFSSNELTVYMEDEIKLNEKWTIRPGLHWANWFSNNNYDYSSLQPRIYTSFTPRKDHTLYASFSHMAQFLHLINTTSAGVPADFWLPSSSRLRPEEALVMDIGYMGAIKKTFQYNISGYYKDIQRITMYNVGKDIFDNTTYWEDKLIQGNGWSYGAEVSVANKMGPFTASVAYTLSWTWRQFEQINNGKAFPYRYDRRHNIKIAGTFQPNKKFSATANWTFMSGEALTMPDQVYTSLDNNLLIGTGYTMSTVDYTYNYVDWNNYRLPSIHRLDVGVDLHKKRGKYLERTWSLGIFNVYGRRNIMYTELVNEDNAPGMFMLRGISYLQFIPYVTFKLKF